MDTVEMEEIRTKQERIVGIRDRLRRLGYCARIANGTCIDLDDGAGRLHYLSFEEADALADSSIAHPADLEPYGERRGYNCWYTFPA